MYSSTLATGVTAAQPAKPIVVVVTGATGVGKTESSLRLAELLNGEIISADSVQVYRQLDIGSDKLPLEDRRGTSPGLCPPCMGQHNRPSHDSDSEVRVH
jgi:tRNA dimethylallyltransferase